MGTGATIQTGGGGGKRRRSSSGGGGNASYYSKNQNSFVYGIVTEININKSIVYTPMEDRVGNGGEKKGIAYPFYGNNQQAPKKNDIVPLLSGPTRFIGNESVNQYDRTTYYLDPINIQSTVDDNGVAGSGETNTDQNTTSNNYTNNNLGFNPNAKSKVTMNHKEYKTAYPELPFTEPPPPSNLLPYQTAASYLNKKYGDNLGRAVFAVLWAEAAKERKQKSFRSAGGHNYAGVQTDNTRWGAPGIIGQYSRVDNGNVRRSFAIFENDNTFLDFMADRIRKKGLNGSNGDIWTTNYINSWWSPAAKASYTKGTTKFNEKLAIFNTAMSNYNTLIS